MEQAYIGTFGGYFVVKEGDEKHTATHIVLTSKEYNKLISDKNRLISLLNTEKRAHTKDVTDEKNKSIQDKNIVVNESNEAINRANLRAETAEAEARRQAELNKNLIRISKEKNNAARRLQPKKTHSGYRYIDKIMQIKAVKDRTKKDGNIYGTAWTATLETPYDATIPINLIEDKIKEDLFGDNGLCGRMNINIFTVTDDAGYRHIWTGEYKTATENLKENDKRNFLYDIKYSGNPKSRLWEVQIYTTEAINVLPELCK